MAQIKGLKMQTNRPHNSQHISKVHTEVRSLGLVGRMLLLVFVAMVMVLTGCNDRLTNNPNPNAPGSSFTLRPLNVRIYANQAITISIPDSNRLAVSGFSVTYGQTGLGTITTSLTSPAVTFTPVADTIGTATIPYKVYHNNRCDSSVINLTILDPSTCVLAAANDTLKLINRGHDSISLATNDNICPNTRFTIVSGPSFGTARISSTGTLTYTLDSTRGQLPTQGDLITYRISAPRKVSQTAQLLVTQSFTCQLTANADRKAVMEGQIANLPVLQNDIVCGVVPQIIIDRAPRIGLIRPAAIGGTVRYEAPLQVIPGTVDQFAYHLEVNGRRSNTTTVDVVLTQRCLSSVPTIITREVVQGQQDTISIRTLLFGTAFRICDNASFSVISIQNLGQNQVSLSRFGLLTVITGGIMTNPQAIRLNYQVFDSLTANTQRGAIDIYVRPPVCSGARIVPTDTITDTLALGPMVVDLNQVFREKLPCTVRVNPNVMVSWTGIPTQLVKQNVTNDASIIRLSLRQGANRPLQATLGYSVPTLGPNGLPSGPITGQIVVRFR